MEIVDLLDVKIAEKGSREPLRFDGLKRPSEPVSQRHNIIITHLTKVTP